MIANMDPRIEGHLYDNLAEKFSNRKETAMIKKKVLDKNRIRRIDGGFSFIPHRFLTDGFVKALNRSELLLYFFLVLVGDRNGVSFYNYDAICTLLEMTLDHYIEARCSLLKMELIAFDGTIFQVLELPRGPKYERPQKSKDPVRKLANSLFKEV